MGSSHGWNPGRPGRPGRLVTLLATVLGACVAPMARAQGTGWPGAPDPEPVRFSDAAEIIWRTWPERTEEVRLAFGRLDSWHKGIVWSVAFSPDASRVLTGSADNTAVLHEVATGRTLHAWRHDESVDAVAFSPDGTLVLTGSADDTAVLREVATGRTLHSWRHDFNVMAVAFSPDGTSVLTGSVDYTAVLRDVATGRTLQTWRHEGPVTSVAFGPDGTRVLTGSSDKTAVLRDVSTGLTLQTWSHDGGVKSVAYGPDGTRVLTGSSDHTAVLREVATGQTIQTWQAEKEVEFVAFNPDGTRVLVGTGVLTRFGDYAAVLRDVESGRTLRSWTHGRNFMAVAFSQEGTRVLAGSGDDFAVPRDEGLDLGGLITKRVAERLRPQRYLPLDIFERYRRLKAEQPPTVATLPKLFKDEFESTADFAGRVRAERDRHFARVEKYNGEVAEVLAAEMAFYASAPDRLARGSVPELVAQTVLASFGSPLLENVSYDADTETFAADLGPGRGISQLGLPRRWVLKDKIPRSGARAFKEALEKARPIVRLTLAENAELRWKSTEAVVPRWHESVPGGAFIGPGELFAMIPLGAEPTPIRLASALMPAEPPVPLADIRVGFGPDVRLEPRLASPRPLQFSTGDTGHFRFSIVNQGEDPGRGLKVRVKVKPLGIVSTSESVAIPEIAPGATQDVEVPFRVDERSAPGKGMLWFTFTGGSEPVTVAEPFELVSPAPRGPERPMRGGTQLVP